MITFRLAPHKVRPNVQIVEVLIDGRVSATIVPGEQDVAQQFGQLRIITRHLYEGPTTYNSAFSDGPTIVELSLRRKD